MARHLAQFNVSSDLIRSVFAIPEGTTILDIVQRKDNPGVFVFVVEHPDLLPETPETAAPLEISPVIRANHEKRPETWLTFDFNVTSQKPML